MKTVPQLNILSFGFPVKILVGLGMLAGSLVFVGSALGGLLEENFANIAEWIETLGTAGVIAGGAHG
jgi:flagellar biosynthesis protein FliR